MLMSQLVLGCHLTISSTEENIVSVFWILYDEGGESEGSDDDGGGDSIVRVVEVVIGSLW